MRQQQQQQSQQPPPQQQPQQQQYVIQSHRDMAIGQTKVIEKMQHQVKPVESIAVASYPNYSYAYQAVANPKQYHKNEAPSKVRKNSKKL